MNITSTKPVQDDLYPQGVVRVDFKSEYDGKNDWALFMPGDTGKNTIVYMHGSFSTADQIFTRADIRNHWLERIRANQHPLLSLNLRGTEYMSPAVTADTTAMLDYCRAEHGCKNTVLLGGSGGASSAMAYAVLHPDKIQGVVAMGMCDIFARLDFARKSANPTLKKLAASVFAAYGGDLESKKELYAQRSVLKHAERLMDMPVILTIGEKDPVIPATETRKIAEALRGNPRFIYREIPDGGHDSALWIDVNMETLEFTDR